MYIAIDIGGTTIRVAEFDTLDHPQLLNLKTEKTNPDYHASLESVKKLIGDRKPDKIGVGAPGATNLPDWADHDLQADLTKILGAPVQLANDVAAAASGEAIYGTGETDFLLVSWGTGIGGAFVQAGQVFPTQLGHQIIVVQGKTCGCGQQGCLEAYCGGRYIPSDNLLPQIVPYFAQGLVSCMAIHPIPLIIFAGGLAMHQPHIVEQIALAGRSLMKIMPFPKVQMATYLDKAGIYGALSLLKSTL